MHDDISVGGFVFREWKSTEGNVAWLPNSLKYLILCRRQ